MPSADREKWDRKYRDGEHATGDPAGLLIRFAEQLPRAGRAIDVAGGAGRNAVWLAARGLDVTIADISPVGLELASQRGRQAGVSLDRLEVDLERQPFPAGPWDVIVCFHYLHRPLFAQFFRALVPGGWFVFAQPTKSNLQRHPRPSERFLLDDGELLTLVDGWDIVHYEEGWQADGQHMANLVARRPAI